MVSCWNRVSLVLQKCDVVLEQPGTALYKCQPSSSSPVSFSASREVGRRPLPPSSLPSSSLITFFANMRTFLLIAVVSLSSAANVKREADAEATAEADASADPAYGRHRGHAG